RSAARSAHAEAVLLIQRGLELVPSLPASAERSRRELALQSSLGPSLIATRGYGSKTVEQTYARARQLCDEVGDAPELFPVLFGLVSSYAGQGQLTTGRAAADRMVSIAEEAGDSGMLVVGRFAAGIMRFYLADLDGA